MIGAECDSHGQAQGSHAHRHRSDQPEVVGGAWLHSRRMSVIVVEGGARLQGTVGVRGAKNAVLKEMVSALLAPGRHRLTNVPTILDVELMCQVLEHIGCRVEQGEPRAVGGGARRDQS